MKAFRVIEPDNFQLVEMDVPAIKPDEVLVQVKAVGICGGDPDILDGSRPRTHVSYPIVPGHEFSGEIVETGSVVTGLKPGDRVTAEGVKRCDSCRNCLTGRTSTCLHYDEIGFTSHGAMADYVAVPQRIIHRVPDDIPYGVAALSEPAAVAATAVYRAGINPGDTVVIIGAGAIGMLAVQVARLYSPHNLVVVEVDDRKLDISSKLGATHTINSTRQDAASKVMELTDMSGADVVIECAGTVESLSSTFDYVVKNAKIIVLGTAGGGQTIALDSDNLVNNDILYQGIAGYSHLSFGWTQRLLTSGFFDSEAVITHHIKLQNIYDGFHLMKNKSELVIKVMITP